MKAIQSSILGLLLLSACGGDNPPDVSNIGKQCTKNSDCTTGLCLPQGAGSACTASCGMTTDCTPGWSCMPAAGQSTSVCQCLASKELCDGLDNDCDGAVDNNADCGAFLVCAAAKCVQCTPTPTVVRKFVINTVTVPQDRQMFALDLNGDGKADNQLGNVMGALSAVNLQPQADVDAAVAAGKGLMLLQPAAADATFANDSCSRVVFQHAVDHPAPDFSGAGSFTVDNSVPASNFTGAFMQSRYASDSPVTTKFPVSIVVSLPFFGTTPIQLPLFGAHVQFTQGSGLTQGQLNGAIKSSDVQTVLIPGMAAGLDAQVKANPGDPNSQQLKQIFDTDNNGTITAAEVANNSIIKNVMAPDVQLFDAAGHYAPSAANSAKDSLSVGFGFTAAAATF